MYNRCKYVIPLTEKVRDSMMANNFVQIRLFSIMEMLWTSSSVQNSSLKMVESLGINITLFRYF